MIRVKAFISLCGSHCRGHTPSLVYFNGDSPYQQRIWYGGTYQMPSSRDIDTMIEQLNIKAKPFGLYVDDAYYVGTSKQFTEAAFTKLMKECVQCENK